MLDTGEGVALVLPAFVGDLRNDGWTTVRRPLLSAVAATMVAVAALVALRLHVRDVFAASILVAFALFSLVAWTHAATVAARRLAPLDVHTYLALLVSAAMLVMTVAAAIWFASVTAHAPSFVGAAQLAVIATFMLLGTALAAGSVKSLRA